MLIKLCVILMLIAGKFTPGLCPPGCKKDPELILLTDEVSPHDDAGGDKNRCKV